jgi:signal transduction histidine kinase
MTARHFGTPSRRGRVSSRLLWILGTALGGATIVSAGTMLHDTSRRKEAARLVARATAEQAVVLATERLQILVHSPSDLAGTALFRFDVPAKRVYIGAASRDGRLPPGDVLSALANAAAERATGPRRITTRIVTDPRLDGRAILTTVALDSSGNPLAVDGLVADARAVARLLFAPMISQPPTVDSPRGIVRLDSLSLEVRGDDRRVLFGSLADETTRPYRATVRAIGPLEGITVGVAVAGWQIPRAFVSGAPQMELWHLGMLFLCTTIVIAAAAGSARRELALARARSDFIAGVSHELRMPLAQILLAGETLTMQRERDADERERLATSIVREAMRLIALVENVLFFSRSGAVAFTPTLEPIPVQSLFTDLAESVQLAVDDAGHRLEVDVAASLAVSADRQLVRQALVNLVDNALKYGRRGLRIRLSAEEAGPGRVRLYVDDEGPGIPAAERVRVFEAYERLARDQTSERTGSGLGLAIVRQIARRCGGDAWLDDAPSGGTRAVIELRASALPSPVPETSGVA